MVRGVARGERVPDGGRVTFGEQQDQGLRSRGAGDRELDDFALMRFLVGLRGADVGVVGRAVLVLAARRCGARWMVVGGAASYRVGFVGQLAVNVQDAVGVSALQGRLSEDDAVGDGAAAQPGEVDSGHADTVALWIRRDTMVGYGRYGRCQLGERVTEPDGQPWRGDDRP